MNMPTTEITTTAPALATAQPERTPDPCIVVIFGASATDQAQLLPALYHLEQSGLLLKTSRLSRGSKAA